MKNVKIRPAMFLMIALLLGGFINASHAGTNPEHAQHDSNRKHECQQQAASTSKNSDTSDAFCEAACHAPLMVNGIAMAQSELISFDNTKFTFAANVVLSWLHAVPDHPPRLS